METRIRLQPRICCWLQGLWITLSLWNVWSVPGRTPLTCSFVESLTSYELFVAEMPNEPSENSSNDANTWTKFCVHLSPRGIYLKKNYFYQVHTLFFRKSHCPCLCWHTLFRCESACACAKKHFFPLFSPLRPERLWRNNTRGRSRFTQYALECSALASPGVCGTLWACVCMKMWQCWVLATSCHKTSLSLTARLCSLQRRVRAQVS